MPLGYKHAKVLRSSGWSFPTPRAYSTLILGDTGDSDSVLLIRGSAWWPCGSVSPGLKRSKELHPGQECQQLLSCVKSVTGLMFPVESLIFLLVG